MSQWVPVFEEQLTALPGWTGLIKQRADDEGVWQSAYPISLAGYLAARLALLDAVGADIAPSNDSIDRTRPPNSPGRSCAPGRRPTAATSSRPSPRRASRSPTVTNRAARTHRWSSVSTRARRSSAVTSSRGRLRDPWVRRFLRDPDGVPGIRHRRVCQCLSTDSRPAAPRHRRADRRRHPGEPRPLVGHP